MGTMLRLLITAGPTHEPIDAVRYLGNRSSGRMGLALANAGMERGWPVTLLLGPTALPVPLHSQLRSLRFRTTSELQELLKAEWPGHDVLLMAAAVADYRPLRPPEPGKLARQKQPLQLLLEPTPDLLAELARITRPNQTVVGFALEPAERLLASAREKLTRKAVDAIVANSLETIESDRVTATVLLSNGEVIQPEPHLPKTDFARWLLQMLEPVFCRKHLATSRFSD